MNSKFKKILLYVIIVVSTLIILASLLSLLYDIPKWYLKVLDFPRIQQMILGIFLLLIFIIINKKWNFGALALSLGLVASIFIHFNIVSPYLMGNQVVPNAKLSEINGKKTASIIITNVLITNKNSEKLLELIKKENPDMVLAMEVDSWWVDELKVLKKDYTHVIEYPLDNAYGMALYSKFPLNESQIQFLNHSKVPSFNTKVQLASGDSFKFHGVHPVAPFPSDKYPDNIGSKNSTNEEEVALQKVGKLVEQDQMPSIVAGDFNDVAWSNTSRLFSQNGNLKDVRIGRGLYNTFNAESSFMRWPLDHFFVSENIKVIEFKRLSKIDSDHFPLYAKFHLE